MILYLDESGDLGFKFDAPYGKGGSSRYLTIALLMINNEIKHLTKRIVKKVYKRKKVDPYKEFKATDLTEAQLRFFSERTKILLDKKLPIKLIAITVKKENVLNHIRKDHNKLYNYMIKLAIEGNIPNIHTLYFVPDPRSIKVKSGFSLVDYLQTEIWFTFKYATKIIEHRQESHSNYNLQFVDYLANIIWSHYEFNNDTKGYSILSPYVDLKELFF